MKKIGIITMHRPISFGSALQAYALQKKFSDLGYDAEIIDYQYPNHIHSFNKKGVKAFINTLASFIFNALFGFPNIIKKKRFEAFRKNNTKLSRYYPTAESLELNPPEYDIYCTGSDQVWNALFTKDDTSFLLSFIKGGRKKFSYASSFAIDYVPDNYKTVFANYLSEYKYISVRERSGLRIVKELTRKDAQLVCDPTLLLNRKEWDLVAEQTQLKISRPYILVFMLCYSFNPYPQVQHVINTIQSKLNLPVLYLDGGKRDYFRHNSKVIKTAGPSEFVDLIRNADYVITSSFHGVVFSSIFERPFTAIVKSGNSDSRINSFLDKVGLSTYAVPYDRNIVELTQECDSTCLDPFITESVEYLKSCLQS